MSSPRQSAALLRLLAEKPYAFERWEPLRCSNCGEPFQWEPHRCSNETIELPSREMLEAPDFPTCAKCGRPQFMPFFRPGSVCARCLRRMFQ